MSEIWCCLVKVKMKHGFRSHLIEKPSFTLGRTQEADLPVVQKSVSRVHLHVEIKGDLVWISDQKSANGTTLNGKPLHPGQSVAVTATDIVRIGTLDDEFCFQAIPKPFELLDGNAQKAQVISSMEEIATTMEAGARERVEKELRQARLEAEQVVARAKKESEILKTKELDELQARKQELESNIAKLRAEAQAAVSVERLTASKEADALIAEAQRKLQNDYAESSARIEARIKDAHEKSAKMLSDADEKARAIIGEAREEAGKVRAQATDDARALQQQATRKATEAAAQIEASGRDALAAQQKSFEQQWSTLKADLEKMKSEKAAAERDLAAAKEEFATGHKLLAEMESMEARRAKAEAEWKEFTRNRDDGLGKLEAEMAEKRERGVVENEKRRKEQEAELAKAKLKGLEDVQAAIKAEEHKYEQVRKLRAVELGQRLHERILPKLKVWVEAGKPEAASAAMKSEIEIAVTEIVLGEDSKIQMTVTGRIPTDEERQSTRARHRKFATIGATLALIAVGFYGRNIVSYLEGTQKTSYASKIMENRRIQSLYNPEQNDQFRDTYTDNVLFMRGYLQTKTNQAYVDKWTLKLNDIAFLKPLGLSEEDVVQYIAKEMNLVQRLGVLRSSIDAVYLNEGIDRMRTAEDEDVRAIVKILKGEENFRKIRNVEKEFLKDFMKK